MPNVYLVEIDQQPIELYKLLKIADLVTGGGEAKVVISEGYVLLNNEVEFQKRKKVYHGDYIQFGDNIIEVQFVEKLITESSEDEVIDTKVAPQSKSGSSEHTPNNNKSNKNKQPDSSSRKNKRNKSKTNKKTSQKNEVDHQKGKRRRISF